jgi:hypothetical protein
MVAENVGKRPAVHVPEDEVRLTIVFAVVIKRHDGVMPQGTDEACLPLEALAEVGVTKDSWPRTLMATSLPTRGSRAR